MTSHDIIVIGASAGGVEALTTLVGTLPADLNASIFIVLHISAQSPSVLAQILARAGPLPADAAQDGAPIEQRHIYVARSGHHLMLTLDGMRVIRGPRENHSRPAIDVLFRTAALTFGPRVIGVILTGMLNDGTAGLLAVKKRGGIAVVQDPATALFSSMPASACRYVDVDHVVPLEQMPTLLTQLVTSAAPNEERYPVDDDLRIEAELAGLNPESYESEHPPGKIAAYTCPECHGPMWEMREGALIRYRCRVGHAYTQDAMLQGLTANIEDALWTAINTLEESSHILIQMAENAHQRHHDHIAKEMTERAAEKQRHARLLRQVLLSSQL